MLALVLRLSSVPNRFKVNAQDCKDSVALQVLVAFERSDGRFVISEYLDHLWDEMGWGFRERERDEPNRCIGHLDSLQDPGLCLICHAPIAMLWT